MGHFLLMKKPTFLKLCSIIVIIITNSVIIIYIYIVFHCCQYHCGRFQLPVQSVPITTKIVSSNPVHGEMYSIQYYVIKFVNDLRQVGGFHRKPNHSLVQNHN
jgi:hypothetical protein